MKKAWLLAFTTYRRQIRTFSYKLLTFGFPLVFVFIGTVAYLFEFGAKDLSFGYVDETQTLAQIENVEHQDIVLHLAEYNSPAAALDAYKQGEIAGYLLIPYSYYDGAPTALYGSEAPNARTVQAFAKFMRKGMFPEQPEWIYNLLENPSETTYIQVDTGITVTEGPAALLYFAIPSILAVIMIFSIFTGVNQMGSAAVAEKDDRLLEVILSTMSDAQFIVGKVTGVAGLVLTQLGVWFGGLMVAALIPFGADSSNTQLSQLPPTPFVWALLLGIPLFLLYSMLAAGAGIAAGDGRQAQQLAGLLTLLCLAPVWLLPVIIENPEGTAALALSLFPLTGPFVLLFRMTLTEIPFWQPALSLLLVLISLVLATLITAWIQRAALIMQGQSLFDRSVWRAALLEVRLSRSSS
jgi:ABC-2 type transport system permease protein